MFPDLAVTYREWGSWHCTEGGDRGWDTLSMDTYTETFITLLDPLRTMYGRDDIVELKQLRGRHRKDVKKYNCRKDKG